ncbi:MAG: hypothetical protein EPN88_01255 [Bacteroidetes bacterium]|nr:MAG: hypothetical protein EPN88_01255 [Bacteroidota bacterium]
MKKIITIITALVATVCVFAQVPQKMSYQAVIRNSSNDLVSSTSVGIRISILQGSEGGTPVYVETQTTTTNANGLVSIEIGGGTPVTGTFAGIDWSAGTYFIKTETDPAGGTNYTITGAKQILSVPYALHAKTSGTATDAVKITDDQSIADHKTFTGTITVPIPINSTDAATKAYVDALKTEIRELQILAGLAIKDIDGNVYRIVTIGTQQWIAENLKTTKYNDGTPVSLITDITAWAGNTTGAYCWYNNDEATNKNIYGALYNWYAVNTAKLCPIGWHVSSDDEWTTLTTFLGGESVAGSKLKETGTAHWVYPNTDATNETGFTALPGNYRDQNGSFYDLPGNFGLWWTSTEFPALNAYYRWMTRSNGTVTRDNLGKKYGFSVRCIKD